MANEQIKDRTSGLGGSDAPVCAGVSQWKSPLELFYEKRGELDPSIEETEAIEWGTRLEGIVAEAYSEKTGRTIRRQPRKSHPDFPWMLGNIDRQIVGDKRGVGILEVKTTNTFSLKDWENGPTDSAMLQLQHYLAIYGYQWGSIAVLVGGQHFKHFDVERDNELIDYLIQIELKFWTLVQKNEPPDHTWTPETVGMLKKLYPTDSGKEIVLDMPEASIMYERYQLAKSVLAQQKTEKAEAEGWLKAHMLDASIAVLGNGATITWKSTKASQKFDMERFEKEHPLVCAQFQKTVPGYRRFLVKPQKGLLP